MPAILQNGFQAEPDRDTTRLETKPKSTKPSKPTESKAVPRRVQRAKAERYVVDCYAQQHPSDDDVNVDCVCTWRLVEHGDARDVAVDFHNGWGFDSTRSPWVPRSRRDQLIRELRRIGNASGST